MVSMIMDRYEFDDVAHAVALLQLSISDYLPRRGTNRLRYLTGITTTPQGIAALDQANSKLRPQTATETEKYTGEPLPTKLGALADETEKQEVIQQYPPMRRSRLVKPDTTTNHSTVGADKFRELLSDLRHNHGQEDNSQ